MTFHLGLHCLHQTILVCVVLVLKYTLTLYLIETPFNALAKRADLDQAALIRAA